LHALIIASNETSQVAYPLPPLRTIHTIISPEREVVRIHLKGQYFDLGEGESVDELRQRAMRAAVWDD
jgi:hypothetical protein